jgi:predicted PhzF superfamily epimerase YddE/YHI9
MEIPVPDTSLGIYTRRALIVTCAVSKDLALQGENIHLRYFAPQYGIAEDAATGSAMRVLAGYWQQRGLGDELQALQRSPEGGLLWSRVQNQTTWVGGYVSFTAAVAEVASA